MLISLYFKAKRIIIFRHHMSVMHRFNYYPPYLSKFMLKVIFIILSMLAVLSSCTKNENIQGFDRYEIDENIQNNKIFENLNKTQEFDFGYDFRKIKKNQKRSNNLKITTELGGIKNHYDEFNSESFFYTHFDNKRTDTIILLIDNFNGYSGEGITLKIYKNYFKLEYLQSGDMIINTKKRDSIKIFESSLKLNKKKYQLNDSIYGYLNLKMEKNKERINATGYFRTKITPRYQSAN